MGILNRIGLFRGCDAPVDRTSGNTYSFFMGGSVAGKNVNERSAMQMTAVYAGYRSKSNGSVLKLGGCN